MARGRGGTSALSGFVRYSYRFQGGKKKLLLADQEHSLEMAKRRMG